MEPLATLGDLSRRLGIALDPGTPDGERGEAALDDASSAVRDYAETDWVDEHGDPNPPPGIVRVVLQVAQRVYRNPHAASQTSVGDVNLSFSRESGQGAVYLTRQEKEFIDRAVGRVKAGSMSLSSPWFKEPKPPAGGEWWETEDD